MSLRQPGKKVPLKAALISALAAPSLLSLLNLLEPAHVPVAMPLAGFGGAIATASIKALLRNGRFRISPRTFARVCEAVYYGIHGEHSRQWWNRLNSLNDWRDLIVLPEAESESGSSSGRPMSSVSAPSPEALEVYAALADTLDPVLMKLLLVDSGNKEIWEQEREALVALVRDPARESSLRLRTAQVITLHEEVLGTDLLTDLVYDSDVSNAVRFKAADELFRWDPARAQLCYEHLASSADLEPDEQITAAERLGRCDRERAAAALADKSADREVPLRFRFLAAEKTGEFDKRTRRGAFWNLVLDTSIDIRDRIDAGGRLLDLGDLAAAEWLRLQAELGSTPEDANALCRYYLRRAELRWLKNAVVDRSEGTDI